jgi:hypothetical protein
MNHLQQNIKQKMALIPIALGATGVMTGLVIDRKGYEGVEIIIDYGSITTTGTNIAVLVKEGDVTGTLTSVADSDLIGTETLASLLATTPRTAGTTKEVSKRIGYKGNKRYVNLVLTHSGTTSVGCVAASAILHTPEAAPVDNP